MADETDRENSQQFEGVASEGSDARFTMRSLFIATAVVAVIAALAGPIVRSFSPETQRSLLISWGIWLAAILALLGYLATKRKAAETLAGRALLRLLMYDERVVNTSPFRRRLNVGLTIFFTLLMLTYFGQLSSVPITRGGLYVAWNYLVMLLSCVWWPAHMMTSLWWRNNVRFGERGVLWDRRVMLWDHIVRSKWDASSLNVLEINGIDQNNHDMNLRILVPVENRGFVEALLKGNVVDKPPVAIEFQMAELGRLPLSVAARDRRFLKYVGAILLFVVLFIGGMFLVGNGVTGIDEFDRSIVFGLILAGVASSLWRGKPTQPLGVPLARIYTSRAWLAAIPTILALVSCYWLGYDLGSTSVNAAYFFGICFGVAASLAMGFVAVRKPMDFRENGIYMMGATWAWDAVKLIRWNTLTGDLTLRLGRRRVAARVPAEQRDVVDRVLGEKLGS